MNKFFSVFLGLALCSVACSATASVIPLAGLPEYEARQAQNKNKAKNPLELPPGMPDPNDQEAVREFFKKRFEEVAQTPMDKNIQWDKPSSTNVVPPPEFYEQEKEEKKSTFEKIYEETLKAFQEGDKKKLNEGAEDVNEQEQKAAA